MLEVLPFSVEHALPDWESPHFVRMSFGTNSSGKVETNDLMFSKCVLCTSIFTKPYDQHQNWNSDIE